MKTFVKIAFALAIGILFPLLAAAQNVPTGQARLVYGDVKDHVYTNKVIGLWIQIPKEMEIDDPSFVDVALVPTQVPGSVFAGQTLAIKSLFSARAFPVMFMCTATKLPPKLAKLTGEQILNDRLFKEPAAPPARLEKLGKNTMAYVDGKTRFNVNRSYAVVTNGYYISIVIGYKNADELEIMRQYLASADLAWTGM